MKRFDPESIKNRWMDSLQQKEDWRNIQKGGATEQYLEAQSEPIAEVARYGEYLLREMKWGTNKNFSSAKHQARLVGKKLGRKHSAIGSIIVSHSTIFNGITVGSPRYLNLGKKLTDIDQLSNFDDGDNDETLTGSFLQSLTPWLSDTTYNVPIGAVFTNNVNGLRYVAAQKKEIKKFTNKWSRINNNQTLKDAFYSDGGWEGYKYLSVPIVQGEVKEVVLGVSDNTASQSFLLDTLDVEAADSYYTKQFCYVEVIDEAANEATVWEEVYHLTTKDAVSRSFEINILDDMSATEIRFGDGINGAIPPKDAIIVLHYLETKGAEGNVSDLYSFATDFSGAEIPENLDVTLGCQNMWAIFGGSDLEKFSEFKINAETAYEKNYEIMHTYPEFVRRLNEVAPVPIIKPKIRSSWITQDIQGVKVLTPVIGVTGLNGNLMKLTQVEQNLFNKVATKKISDNVLSSKFVLYEEPNIVKINSHISIELKESVISPSTLKSEIESGLAQRIGKYNLDAIDCYRQVRVIQETLNLCDNVASIDTVDLITVGVEDITVQSLGSGADTNTYAVFKFKLPQTSLDVRGVEGFCMKTKADGNVINALINVNLGTLQASYILRENSTASEITQYTANSDMTIASEGKHFLELCSNPRKTLSRSELSGVSEVASTKVSNVMKSLSLDKDTLQFAVGFRVSDIKEYLNLPQLPNDELRETLLNKFAKNNASIDFCFECPDKTLDLVDWNSVWYYDNIEVDINS